MTLNYFIYKVARPFGILQAARFLARNHPRILMYHRISPDGAPGTISVDQFRKQMKLIKKSFNPISLSKLIELHEKGITPRHAVAVTFDDGYSDFGDYAFPVMKEEGIPATLFITTGFVNGDIWLWPDQIKFAIENASDNEKIRISGIDEDLNFVKNKNECWSKIADYGLSLGQEDRLSMIEELYIKLGLSLPRKAPSMFRPVSWDDIKEMMRFGLNVESHSVNHPSLVNLNWTQLKSELSKSRDKINEVLGIESNVFCYPNGLERDITVEIECCVRKAGYNYGVSAYYGVEPLVNRWSINRYPASSQDYQFEKHLFGMTYVIEKFNI
ncbi:polysaccharide deacetylase family protein [Marinobacter sp.]|uniref:polysaccharide deacetylase family protein n=1 Tax=Marinobacter sp. TaxID=50741 RepID=UPI002B2651A0|nr:polysaccharide deacetylase family protein [Marinobacter sp.]